MEPLNNSEVSWTPPEVPDGDIDSMAEQLVTLARTLVADWPRVFPMLRPSIARHGIAAFKAELRSRAFTAFCVDYAGKPIPGGGLPVDYLMGSTVVEVALNLRDPNSEFERSIIKVLMTQCELHTVTHLLFLAKTGARARCDIPARKAVVAWAEREYGVHVEVRELGAAAEGILDIGDE